MGGGGAKWYDSTETLVLYILYSLYDPMERNSLRLCWNFRTTYEAASRNKVVVPARQARLAESIPWNQILGLLKSLKIRAQIKAGIETRLHCRDGPHS
jgi:hypothetical protein